MLGSARVDHQLRGERRAVVQLDVVWADVGRAPPEV